MTTAVTPATHLLHINGQAVDSGRYLDVFNPATGLAIARVAEAGESEVQQAVEAAANAFAGPWQTKFSPAKRGRVLFHVAEKIREHAEELALIESQNAGKPLAWAKGEMQHAAEVFEYYAGAVTKLEGSTIPLTHHIAYTQREPLGVVAQIIPWNFPLVMAAWKLAPALAAGNTVVLKPAEQTPLSALRLSEMLLEAGIPAGVVNVLHGCGLTTGAALVAHPGVAKIAFTGSTAVGKLIAAKAAQRLARVSLELGGKSPNVVFADADLESAVNGSLYAMFDNAGQCCNARSRILVQAPVYDDFVERFVAKAEKIRVGDPQSPDIQMGPLISREQWERVNNYVALARQEGGTVRTGGGRPAGLEEGWFFAPTVITGLSNQSRTCQEEIFGPVVTIGRFEDEAEAVRVANATDYGLYATLWTQDVARAHRVAGLIKAGTVSINAEGGTPLGVPFGGFKQSGWGRELSFETLYQYTEVKSVVVNTSGKVRNVYGV